MSHNYLKDIDISKTPYGWGSESQKENFKKQKSKYGFDEREIWSMDVSFMVWLYERLKMFQEKYNNAHTCYDNLKTYEIEGNEYTLYDCIYSMIEYCKEYFSSHSKEDAKFYKDSVLSIFIICMDDLTL